MSIGLKKVSSKEGIQNNLLLLLTFFLFFSVHKVFITSQSFLVGGYSDFTTFYLYLSDILLISLFLWLILNRPFKRDLYKPVLWLVFWVFIVLVAKIPHISGLNWYFSAKILEFAIVAYGTSLIVFRNNRIKHNFLGFFVILSNLESVLALWQFHVQHSVGGLLHKLGESTLNPQMTGIAKIIVANQPFIRGYGTFTHPNVLSAFLAMGILIILYLFIISSSKTQKIIYPILLLINSLGLTVTFSRAGFLGLFAGLLVMFIGFFVLKLGKQKILLTGGILAFSFLLSFLAFKSYLLTRATISDQASEQRIVYSHIGWQIIKAKPVTGVGIGESILHMQQYSQAKLATWEIQPIHNYFLLAAAELGIPGALILIWIFIAHLLRIVKKIRTEDTQSATYHLLLASILVCFLVLMQFDHYFYTLEQPALLLWIVLGMIAAETKNSHLQGANREV